MTDYEIRTETLSRLSGLQVSCYSYNYNIYYVFGKPNRPHKTVCTYRKAKMFAEGVALGRVLK